MNQLLGDKSNSLLKQNAILMKKLEDEKAEHQKTKYLLNSAAFPGNEQQLVILEQQKTIEKLTGKLQQVEKCNKELEKENEELKTKLSGKEGELEAMEECFAHKKIHVDKAKLIRLEIENKKLEKSLQACKNALNKGTMVNVSQFLSDCEEINGLNRDLEQRKEQCRKYTEANAQMLQDYQKLKEEFKNLNYELYQDKMVITDLDEMLRESTQKCDDLQKAQKQEAHKFSKKIEELELDNSQFWDRLEHKNIRIRELIELVYKQEKEEKKDKTEEVDEYVEFYGMGRSEYKMDFLKRIYGAEEETVKFE